MVDTILSVDDYKNILQNRFNEPKIKFVSSDIKPLSEKVEGIMGDHYKLKITYNLNNAIYTEPFFIKTKPTKTQAQKDLPDQVNAYEKEIFLYNFVLKEFEKYGYDTSFAPKCYYCIPEKTIVMEDVTTRNFVISKKRKFFDLQQCKTTFRALALFHGAAFAYEQEKSKELGRPFSLEDEYPKILEESFFVEYVYPDKPKSYFVNFVQNTVDIFVDLANILPEPEDFKERLKNRLKEIQIGKNFAEKTKFKKILGHGDLWSNNMLFHFEEGVSKECCLLDFQMLRYYHSSFDVILALYSNTTSAFRKQHAETLFQFYYEKLAKIVKDYGYDIREIYPEIDFRKSIELVKLDAQIQSFSVQSLVFLPMECVKDFVKSDVVNLLSVDRQELTRYACNVNQTYKDILIEDLYEISETLRK